MAGENMNPKTGIGTAFGLLVVAFALLIFFSAIPANATYDCEANWAMNETTGTTVADSSGKSHTGHHPADSGYRPAQVYDYYRPISAGYVLEFDGSDYFYEDTTDAFEFTSDFVITCYVYITNTDYNEICAKYYYDGTNAYGWQFRINSQHLRFTVYDGDTTPVDAYSDNTIPLNTWVWVQCSYSDSSNIIRVAFDSDLDGDNDGYDESTVNDADEPVYYASMPDLRIGSNSNSYGGWQYFTGKICKMDIYG